MRPPKGDYSTQGPQFVLWRWKWLKKREKIHYDVTSPSDDILIDLNCYSKSLTMCIDGEHTKLAAKRSLKAFTGLEFVFWP